MKRKLVLLSMAVFAFCCASAQIKMEDLKIDTTITGFHFAADFQGTKVFTKNGPPDIQSFNPTAFSFTVAQGLTADQAKAQFEMLLNLSSQNGYKISEMTSRDTTLAGNTAYYITYTETIEKENYKNIIFNAFVIKDKTLILFVSGDLDNGKYIEKFKRTFYGIKL